MLSQLNKHVQRDIYLNDEFFPGCKYKPLFEYFPSEIVDHIISFLPERDDDNCKQHYINKMFPDEFLDEEEDYFVNEYNKYCKYEYDSDFLAEFEKDLSDEDIDKWIY